MTDDSPTTVPDDAGFTVTALLAEPPEVVFAYVIEPGLLAQWFVVDGFTTPADRLRLDARPGGAISGVMISDSGTELTFHARYGRLDPPYLAQLVFTDPDETVTLDLQPAGRDGTRIGYHNPSSSPDAADGAAAMLDALRSALARRAPEDGAGTRSRPRSTSSAGPRW